MYGKVLYLAFVYQGCSELLIVNIIPHSELLLLFGNDKLRKRGTLTKLYKVKSFPRALKQFILMILPLKYGQKNSRLSPLFCLFFLAKGQPKKRGRKIKPTKSRGLFLFINSEFRITNYELQINFTHYLTYFISYN